MSNLWHTPALRAFGASAALLILLAGCRSTASQRRPEAFYDLLKFDKTIVIAVRYATTDNFTRTILYPVNRCALRGEVASRVARVQKRLRARGLGLKVWDCYRPHSIQHKLWKLVPDPRYVADPKTGSRHNRGAAIDLTLIGADGQELSMPTDYDDFTEKAHRSYRGGAPETRINRELLRAEMEAEGFLGLNSEWWHFDYKGWRAFPIENIPLESIVP